MNLAKVLVGLLIVLLPAAAFAGDGKYAIGIGFDYYTGDYGTSEDTDSYSIPLTINYYPTDRWDFQLEIPYVHVSSSSTLRIGDIQVPVDNPPGAGDGTGSGNGSGSGTGSGTGLGTGSTGVGSLAINTLADDTTTYAGISDSQSGLGDSTLSFGYIVVMETDSTPEIRPNAYIKIPTGDEDKGLGTGEFEYGVGVDVSRWWDDWFTYVEAAYNFQNGDEDWGLKDYPEAGVGVGYSLTKYLFPVVSLWGASAPSDESSSLLEATLELNILTSKSVSMQIYGTKGLADSSPDYGVGGSIFWLF